MLPTRLCLNKNMFDRPVPLVVRDMNYDLWEVLGKCVTYSLLDLVYHGHKILFLTEIKKDLSNCIATLQTSTTVSPSNDVTHDLDIEFMSTNHFELTMLCKFLIGESSVSPSSTPVLLDVIGRRIAPWQLAVLKLRHELSKEKEDRTSFTIERAQVPILQQNGFTITTEMSGLKGTFTFTPEKEATVVDFVTCFKYVDCNIDNYLSTLGGLSPIPHCLVNGGDRSPHIYATTRNLYTEARYLVTSVFPTALECASVLTIIAQIRTKTQCVIGNLSGRLIDYLKRNNFPVATYLSKVYNSNESEVTLGEREIHASHECYAADQDVMSEFYISMEADDEELPDVEEDITELEKDDTNTEEPELDKDLADPEKDEDLESNDGESKVVEDSPSQQKSGIAIEIDPTSGLDAHLYRKEMRHELNRIIESDDSNISVDGRSVLKKLITYWLHLFSPATINDIVSKVVKVKITYKK